MVFQQFPRFVGLSTNLQPVSIAGVTGYFCRKNLCIWESEYIQGLRKNGVAGALKLPLLSLYLQSILFIFFSIWMSKSGLFSSIRAE
jgi:hypothetical protein